MQRTEKLNQFIEQQNIQMKKCKSESQRLKMNMKNQFKI